MKIEDINYTLPTAEITSDDFDREKWLQEHPIDYFKLLYVLFNTTKNAPTDLPRNFVMNVVFELLYPVTRLYIPDTLYKFYSLNDNEELNKKKFSTLQNKQIFMSDIKDFNDPFDGKAFFYDPKQLASISKDALLKISQHFTKALHSQKMTQVACLCGHITQIITKVFALLMI